MSKTIKIPGENFQGGGGGGSDLLSELTAHELSQYVAPSPNTFIDDFNQTGLGTKTNCAEVASALRPNAGATSFNYERIRAADGPFTQASGIVVGSDQVCAVKNSGITSNTIKLQGDLTDVLVNSKYVAVVTELAANDVGADSEKRYVPLKNGSGNVAKFAIATGPTYSSVNDETTIVLTNTESLDLKMGIADGSLNQYVRVVPFDYNFQAKAGSGSSYEDMDVVGLGMYSPPVCRLPGENFFSKIGSLAGTVLKQDIVMSQNKQYGVAKMLVKTSGNSLLYWFWSANYGKSWTQFSTTKARNAGESEEMNGDFAHENHRQIFVANNGKMVSLYEYWNGSGNQVFAVYADLSVTTPTLSDIADRGYGVGIITSGGDMLGIVSGDPTDLSLIAVVANPNGGSTNGAYVYWYTNYGATFLGFSDSGYNQDDKGFPREILITGTGSSHRTHVILCSQSNHYIEYHYWDQGSSTRVGFAQPFGTINHLLLGAKVSNNRMVLLAADQAVGGIYVASGTINGTPSWDSRKALSTQMGDDSYIGWSTAAYLNRHKILSRDLVQNPSNEKHIFAVVGQSHPDGVVRSTLFEITDVTAYLGAQISQYSTNTSYNFRITSDQTWLAQTFLAAGQRLRTVSVRIGQNGSIPAGYPLTMEIQQTTGGLPNGTVVAASDTIYYANNITKNTSGQWVHFNFATTTLPSATLAIVLKSTFPINGSNYLFWATHSSNPYASGQVCTYNGSIWSASPSYDMVFEINGEWVTDLSAQNGATDQQIAHYPTTSPFGIGIQSTESQIELIDSNIIQWITRRIPAAAINQFPISGHPFRRTISIGSGGVKSIISDVKVAGYSPSNYDPFLIYNVSLGNPDCEQLTTTTGVGNGLQAEDRSGLGLAEHNGSTYSSANFVADSDFASGRCMSFGGAHNLRFYPGSAFNVLSTTDTFAIEAEVKIPSVIDQPIITKYDTTTGYGWIFGFDGATGALYFQTVGTGGVSVVTRSSDVSPTTYHRVRMVLRGGKVYLYRATVAPYTNFVEVSYNGGQPTHNDTGNTNSAYVGSYWSGSTHFLTGKIGYIKVYRDATGGTWNGFKYDGWRNQAALTSIQNIGTRVAAKQVVGQISTTLNNIYCNPGIISGDVAQASMIDSYDMILSLKKQISTPGSSMYFKLTGGRAGNRDQSSTQGIAIQFSK